MPGVNGSGCSIRDDPCCSIFAFMTFLLYPCQTYALKEAFQLPDAGSNRPALVQAARLDRRQLEEVFDKGEHSSIHPLDLWVGRFDDIILVWGVRSTPVAEAKVSRGQAQRLASENESRPGAGVARPEDRIDSRTAIDRQLGFDEIRIARRARP